MSLLSKVTKGPIKKPVLALVHGMPGVGKSTFAADFPSPIFLGSEDGTNNLSVTRFPSLESFGQVLEAMKELTTANHDYKTLVIDSLDWLEPLVFKSVCQDARVDSIEEAHGGYGKGYVAALDKWRTLIAAVSGLRAAKGMHVVVIAHSQVKRIDDAVENKAWDRVTLKLNEKASALWQEFCDGVLYATYQIHTKQDDANKAKTRAYSSGQRVLFTEWRPTFVAKQRWGIPFEIPLSAEAFFAALEAGRPEDPEVLLRQIDALLGMQRDAKLVATVRDHLGKIGANPIALSKTLNRLQAVQLKG